MMLEKQALGIYPEDDDDDDNNFFVASNGVLCDTKEKADFVSAVWEERKAELHAHLNRQKDFAKLYKRNLLILTFAVVFVTYLTIRSVSVGYVDIFTMIVMLVNAAIFGFSLSQTIYCKIHRGPRR